MSAQAPLVMALDGPGAAPGVVGGKGASLARLARAGFRVPPGFHVTTSAYLDFIDLGGLRELRGSFKLAFGVDDFRPALAFGFGLTRDGALHLLGNIHLLDFNLRDFNTPGLGILVKDHLQLAVNFFAFGENLVELELADYAAQSGLRFLRSGVKIVLHLRKSEVGVDHAEIADRVHLHRDVIARDDVLRGDIERFDAQ